MCSSDLSGDTAICKNEYQQLEVIVDIDDSMRQGVVALPHGYGMRYQGQQNGPALNNLTHRNHCDPLSHTPYHKYVPVQISKAELPVTV